MPVRASETEGRQGKAEDGTARTREVKLARLFTESGPDSEGRPVMDPGSSSYVATFDGKDALAGLVGAEYLRRGGDHFRQVVALGDGAAWIWTMAEALYPHATHIVDIYHAREHLHDLAAHLAFITPDPPQWLAARLDDLDAGNIEAIIGAARQYPLDGIKAEDLDKKLRLLRAQHPPDALRPVQEPWHVHRIRRHRGSMQANRRRPGQAVGHALDRRGRRRHHRATLPARQRPLGRALASRHPHPSPATRRRLTDNTTQTSSPEPPPRSSPTILSCTPGRGCASIL